MTVGDRIRTVRKLNGMTQKEFSEKILFANSTVCLLENDKIKRNERAINAICKEFGICKNWLLYGYGEMYDNTEKINPSLAVVLSKYPSLNETLKISSAHMTKTDWEAVTEFLKGLDE